jgi:RNA polymerase sigma factor FliA
MQNLGHGGHGGDNARGPRAAAERAETIAVPIAETVAVTVAATVTGSIAASGRGLCEGGSSGYHGTEVASANALRPEMIPARGEVLSPDAKSGAKVDTLPLVSRREMTTESYAATSRGGQITAEQERMMIDHLPTVRFLARRIHERLPQHVEIEDLVSAGVLGLMDALQKFDPEKKVQFRSYAQFRIRGAILDSLRTLDWGPRDLRRKGRAIEEAIRTLTTRMGRSPSENEVAEEMAMDLGEYQQLLGELKGLEIGTLHAERSEDSGEEELAYIPNRPEDDPLFRCLRGEMQARLSDAIDELPERERLVMTLYYYEEMTMKEIGLTLGVVESRVSQIHASAVLHLRSLLGAIRGSGSATGQRAGKSASQ